MSSTQMIVLGIVLILVVLVAGVLGAWILVRRQSLRQQFGSEYDRVVSESDSRLAAEHELRDKHNKHSALEMHELTPQTRASYAQRWRELQIEFGESPQDAVNVADDLVTQLIEELGYPAGDHRRQIAHLSVDHASTLESYRQAHEISARNRRGEATTEQLRMALTCFRHIVARLLGEEPTATPPPRLETTGIGQHTRADMEVDDARTS